MAQRTTWLYLQQSAMVKTDNLDYNEHDGRYTLSTAADYVLLSYASLPAALKTKRIYNAQVFIPVVYAGTAHTISLAVLSFYDRGYFDAAAVTMRYLRDNMADSFTPLGSALITRASSENSESLSFGIPTYSGNTDSEKSSKSSLLLRHNVCIYFPTLAADEVPLVIKDKTTSGLTSSIQVSYDDEIDVTSQVYLTTTPGYFDPRQSKEFAWHFDVASEENYACVGPFEQASASLFWRETGTEEWTEVSVTGNTQTITIPANTFPVGSIDVYISGTDTIGHNSQTSIYTFRTAATLTQTTPVRPMDELVNSAEQLYLTWTIVNNDNTIQTRTDLQYSVDGTRWIDIGRVSGNWRSAYVSPNVSIPGGVVLWRARSYNIDGVAGPWSNAAYFTYVAGPTRPTLTADGAPFTTLSWVSSGQIAYRIRVDGVEYGPFVGTENVYRLPDCLDDGEHTADVEIQGAYGLWSAPGSVVYTVQNLPMTTVRLSGSFDIDVQLAWESVDNGPFYIYRDGKRIAVTTSLREYRDRLSLGLHSYRVLAVHSNGHYSASNVVDGTTVCATMAVTDINAGDDWLYLRTSANSDRTEQYTYSKTHSLRHVLGATYPVLEESAFSDLSGSYEAAFVDKAAADKFWSLRGHVVIVKARGEIMVGLLANVSKSISTFLFRFVFDLQRINWEGVDD